MEKFRLDGKTAIVTGGGSGIGASIAEIFVASGAYVYILDVMNSRPLLNNMKWVHCNVSDQAQVIQAVQEIESEHPVDILVNNAGIGYIGNIEKTSEEDLDRLFAVNVKGVYNCTYAVIGYMKSRKKGVILNMSSTLSTVAIKERFAYSMTKGAVRAMTLSVALDYIQDGIRCNCIAPGRIHTPFVDLFLEKNYPDQKDEMFRKFSSAQPIGRMGQPEEVAHLALYLCSEEAAFVTGCEYPIDGGFLNLMP